MQQNAPFSTNSSRKQNSCSSVWFVFWKMHFNLMTGQWFGGRTHRNSLVLHLIIWLKIFPDFGGCVEAPPTRKPQDFSKSQVNESSFCSGKVKQQEPKQTSKNKGQNSTELVFTCASSSSSPNAKTLTLIRGDRCPVGPPFLFWQEC